MSTFSVLMSIYHKEDPIYVEQCMLSIWDHQTLKPNQIVLVLDGPLPEKLSDIISKWQNKISGALKVIPLSQNIGLGKALNEGSLHCDHEWIFRMDTDDIALSDRFEKQIKYIHSHPHITLFGGQIIEFDQRISKDDPQRNVPLEHSAIIKTAKFKSPFNHMTIAYKKSILISLNGYQHHLFMEDYNLWLRWIAAGHQTANMQDVLVYARTSNGMLGRRRGFDYIKSEFVLAHLKIQLQSSSFLSSWGFFILRSAVRVLPTPLLRFIYIFLLRKK